MTGTECHVTGSSLQFVVGVQPPQATARQTGRANLASGLGRYRHRRCCGLALPRPRDGTSGAGISVADYAVAASLRQRNSVPLRHMPSSTTASFRATATLARRMPERLAIAMPQAFSEDQRLVRVSRTLAAS